MGNKNETRYENIGKPHKKYTGHPPGGMTRQTSVP